MARKPALVHKVSHSEFIRRDLVGHRRTVCKASNPRSITPHWTTTTCTDCLAAKAKAKPFHASNALAALGERFQDTGNGKLRVRTHGGLVITLTIRDDPPTMSAVRMLHAMVLARPRRIRWARYWDRDRRKAQAQLVRRGLAEHVGKFDTLAVTKAGLAAHRRFVQRGWLTP